MMSDVAQSVVLHHHISRCASWVEPKTIRKSVLYVSVVGEEPSNWRSLVVGARSSGYTDANLGRCDDVWLFAALIVSVNTE
jgi:hypothetical protein